MKTLITAVAILLAVPATAHAGTAAATFTADGTFTVPAGVTSLDITAVGGHGSGGYPSSPEPGGRGARITGTLAAAAGTPILLRVGHGGAGGAASQPSFAGGAGGGLAEVLTGAVVRLIAAGGGGAGGAPSGFAGPGGDAGAAGGAGTFSGAGGGGAAGTASDGGAGGAAGLEGVDGTGSGLAGGKGASERGGAGGDGFAGGGGGGAGRFGGGGGGGAGAPGGGGGGSSFVDAAVTSSAVGLSSGGPASVTIVYSETAKPAVGLNAPASNPATLAGPAGTDTGDEPTVIVDLFHGAAATGTPVLSVTADVTAGHYSAPVPPLADGTWTARARQSDAAGNTGTSASGTFAVDRTAPAVTLTAPGAFTHSARPHFAGAAGTAAGDQPTVHVFVYTGPTATGPAIPVAVNAVGGVFAVDSSVDLADGTYTAVARQDDDLGNHGESAPLTFVVDTAAPAPTVDAPPAYNPTALHGAGEAGDVTLTISRGATVVERITTATSGGRYSADLTPLADGAYSVLAQQTDDAGNRGASAAQTFVVDATPPEIEVTGLRAAYAPGEAVSAQFNCTDATAGVAACDAPAALDASAGDHDIPVTATDKAGNTRTVHARYTVAAPAPAATPAPVVVPSRAPAALKITAAKARRKGKTVTLTLRGTGPGAVRATALRHSATGRLVHGAWKVTLRIRTRAKRLTVTVTSSASRVKRTVSVR